MRTVAFSILHYNSLKDTVNCINSIAKLNLEGINIKTFVLDNGSDEKFVVNSDNFAKIGLTKFESDVNLGFTGGHNFIYEKIKQTDFDYFLLLNNDSLLEEYSIARMVDVIDGEKVGGVVPKIYFTKGREFHKSKYHEHEKGRIIWYAGGDIDWDNVESKHHGLDEVDNGQYDKIEKVSFATGACFLIKKEVIEKVGLFDNSYFLYYEDADLSQKIIKAGYQIVYQPKAVVWHNNAGSSGSGSSLHDYYLTRNKMIFGMKYAPLRTRVHLIKNCFHLILNGRKWQKKGAVDYLLHKFGKGSY